MIPDTQDNNRHSSGGGGVVLFLLCPSLPPPPQQAAYHYIDDDGVMMYVILFTPFRLTAIYPPGPHEETTGNAPVSFRAGTGSTDRGHAHDDPPPPPHVMTAPESQLQPHIF